jgi:hypothetical protein
LLVPYLLRRRPHRFEQLLHFWPQKAGDSPVLGAIDRSRPVPKLQLLPSLRRRLSPKLQWRLPKIIQSRCTGSVALRNTISSIAPTKRKLDVYLRARHGRPRYDESKLHLSHFLADAKSYHHENASVTPPSFWQSSNCGQLLQSSVVSEAQSRFLFLAPSTSSTSLGFQINPYSRLFHRPLSIPQGDARHYTLDSRWHYVEEEFLVFQVTEED